MREYSTPLKERQRVSKWYRNRYHSDPEFRLRRVNDARARQGLPPRASIDEINENGRRDAY